jgi:hypothetical protein
VVSRTCDILFKITQIIQDIGLIRNNNNSTKRTNKNYKLKPERKDLRHKGSPEGMDNNERSDEDYEHSGDNKSTPGLPGPASTLCIPTHHETDYHASPVSHPSTPRSLMRTHNGPGDPLPPLSTSFVPAVTCRRNNNIVQYESSDFCDSSSRSSSLTGDLEQDSKEGIEEEELLDPGDGGGTTGE